MHSKLVHLLTYLVAKFNSYFMRNHFEDVGVTSKL